MDCDLCEKRIVELLYGELDERAAAETRNHLEGCPSCKAAFERLEIARAYARRLELAPAPSMSKVLAAAREQAAVNRASREQAAAGRARGPLEGTPGAVEAPGEENGTARFLRWLGGVAMAPQLGVATVLLLVVGIGLWYLPQLEGGGRGAPDRILETDPASIGETTLVPAEPLQLSHDPRTGRVIEVVGPGEGSSVQRETESSGSAVRRTPRAADPAITMARPDEAIGEREIAPDLGAGSVRQDTLPELTTAAGVFEGGALPGPGTGADAPAHAGPAPIAAPAPSPPSAPPVTSPDERSIDDVVALAEEPLAAHALHQQARSLAAAGRCQESVVRYEQLQARHPDYAQSGQASLEAGQCLRRLGRLGSARAAFERAARSSVPTVAGAARREIVELEAQERAASEVPAAAAD
jgi:tetratricopeptide (TPR) repeat protein